MINRTDIIFCVLHRGERAVDKVQGEIPVCANCYFDYSDEYRMADGNLRKRPFLQRLIKASLEKD